MMSFASKEYIYYTEDNNVDVGHYRNLYTTTDVFNPYAHAHCISQFKNGVKHVSIIVLYIIIYIYIYIIIISTNSTNNKSTTI
jgi:hypothetical protein